jgi:hypothetical protein
MPLTLLFSAARTNDDPVEFTNTISGERSLVVEVVNVAGLLRRQAGWVHSASPSGLGDVEISDSHVIMFGKNRCRFDTYPWPYRLKFFPVYGLKKYDIRVYSGTNLATPGTPLNASFVGRLDRGIRGGVIQYRSTTGATWITVPLGSGIVEAYYYPPGNTVAVRLGTGQFAFFVVGTWTWNTATLASYNTVQVDSSSRMLYQIETQQF